MGRSRTISEEEAEKFPYGKCTWYGKKNGWCERPAVISKITKPIHEWSDLIPQPRWLCKIHGRRLKEVDPWLGRPKKKQSRVLYATVRSKAAS